ncbi:MAG TPA: glycosyltransferase family 4 protein, partial [Chryseosolibacter sp.]
MKIVHVSYARPYPRYPDPRAWIRFLDFYTGVLESLARGAEVISIYHIDYKGVVEEKGVQYHFTGLREWQLLMPLKLNRYIRTLRPDVVVVHGLTSPWQVLMLARNLTNSVPIIAEHHAERPLRFARKFLQRLADRHIRAYLFTSRELAQPWIENRLIADARKVKEVMEASSAFCPMPREVASQFTGAHGANAYLWVGRLNSNKDPLTVVNSFLRFLRITGEARLYMIFQTEELLEEIKNVLSAAGEVSRNICLVGKTRREDMQYWFNSADFFISGSHYEGSGIAACEAMSCGCIPVLTDIPSFRMMTGQGKVGLLYEAGNEDALLQALVKSLTVEREGAREKVLRWFRNELSFEAIAEKLMQCIDEV